MKTFIIGFVVLYLMVTAFLYYQDMRFVRRGVVVEARVASLGQRQVYTHTNQGSRYRTYYDVTYEYTLNGEEYSWNPPYMTTFRPEGDTQELVVSRRYPEEAKVNTFFFKYLVPNIMAIIIGFPIFIFITIRIGKLVNKFR